MSFERHALPTETFTVAESRRLDDAPLFARPLGDFVSEGEIRTYRDVLASGEGFLFRGFRPMVESSVGARLTAKNHVGLDWSNLAEAILGVRWSYFRAAMKASLRSLFDPSPQARGGWATNGWAANYYHWFCEVLPKILLLKEFEPDLPILLPQGLSRFVFVGASLRLLGVDDVVFVPAGRSLKVARLSVPTELAPSARQRADLMGVIGHRIAAAVRRERGLDEAPDAPKTKVFVSRAAADKRKFVNEDAIAGTLRAAGYAVVQMEKLSFEDQVLTLANASHLVSMHGAGLTNMMFMAPGAAVLEFRVPENPDCFVALAAACGHRLWSASPGAPDIGSSAHLANYVADPARFAAVLETFDRG